MKQKYPRKTLRLYWQASRGLRGWMTLHISMASLYLFLKGIVVPYLLSQGVRELPIFFKQPNQSFWGFFGPLLGLYCSIQVVGWITDRIGNRAYSHFEFGVMHKLAQQAYDHLSTMSYDFFSSNFAGALVNQATKFVSAFERMYDTLSYDVVPLFIRASLSLIVIALFAPMVSLGMLLFFIVYIFITTILARKRLGINGEAAAARTAATARLADNLTNIAAIKYFAQEQSEKKAYGHLLATERQLFQRSMVLFNLAMGIQGFLLLCFETGAFIASLYLMAARQIDVGQFILIQAYVWNIFGALWGVGRIARNSEMAMADAAEMTTILLTKPEIVDAPDAQQCTITQGEVAIKKLRFSYHKDDALRPVFDNLNLTIKPGEKIGLVGPSGGGKTTITKLLLRLRDVQQGVIELDGHAIATMPQADVRTAISYVPQEPLLFHRSLRENIAYGRPDATMDEIIDAAKKAHADEFIDKLPEGYETLVGERGIKLSGGQRQRIAIARAMLKNAPILMLDEATSALDSHSERLIQDALWQLMEGRTAIVIAHRLSTIQRMDRIVVLEDGAITEQGTHAELIANKATYAQLWSHQSGGFLEE